MHPEAWLCSASSHTVVPIACSTFLRCVFHCAASDDELKSVTDAMFKLTSDDSLVWFTRQVDDETDWYQVLFKKQTIQNNDYCNGTRVLPAPSPTLGTAAHIASVAATLNFVADGTHMPTPRAERLCCAQSYLIFKLAGSSYHLHAGAAPHLVCGDSIQRDPSWLLPGYFLVAALTFGGTRASWCYSSRSSSRPRSHCTSPCSPALGRAKYAAAAARLQARIQNGPPSAARTAS